MARFEYRVETVTLAEPDWNNREGRGTYLKYSAPGTTELHPLNELGKDGWELIYLQPLRQSAFLAVFKRSN